MDLLSLPHHPNGFDDPSLHWDRSPDASVERVAFAVLGFVLFFPLLAAGLFVVCTALWWIWAIAVHVIVPLAEFVEWGIAAVG